PQVNRTRERREKSCVLTVVRSCFIERVCPTAPSLFKVWDVSLRIRSPQEVERTK
ncbi:hypothetical protein GIB67_033224, partial [Kingdonia uniflora]